MANMWLWKFWLVDFQETSSQEPLKGLNWNLVYIGQLFRTSQETSLPSLVKFYSAVLKKKMKMLFPIGFQCKLWPPLVAILNLSLLYNSKPSLAEMFSMRSYTRVVTFVQIRQKTWPPCDFENSDWSIFKKPLHKNRWRDWIEITTDHREASGKLYH
jgi:hypothetical protein